MNSLLMSTNHKEGLAENSLPAAWHENKSLRWTIQFSAILLVFTLIGMIVDQRTLLGDPVWLKPTKFAISTIIYVGSIMWILSMLKDRPRLVSIVSWATAIPFIIELIIISVQAFRGVRSHFNVGTAFDRAVFYTMGVMTLILWVASIVAWVALLRQKFEHRAWGIVVKWALFLTIIGSALGGAMTTPRQAQIETAMEVGELAELGSHSIGAVDGEGEGLPLVGWSTAGGDLRIGHFFGLHALQILPLIGLALLWIGRNKSDRQQRILMHIASLGYLGFISLITWQAFRGEPLIAPSALTLQVSAIFFSIVVTLAALVLLKKPANSQMAAA